MHKDTDKITELNDLDALFSQARDDQPTLSESNFTKVVINSLPSNVSRIERRSLSFDLLGMVMGLVAVYFFIEPSQLLSAVLNVVPETLTLSATTLVAGLIGGLALSVGAWWAVEKVA